MVVGSVVVHAPRLPRWIPRTQGPDPLVTLRAASARLHKVRNFFPDWHRTVQPLSALRGGTRLSSGGRVGEGKGSEPEPNRSKQLFFDETTGGTTAQLIARRLNVNARNQF